MPKPTTVDEYLASFPPLAQKPLAKLRKLCLDTAPAAAEQLKWNYPAYVHPDGVILFMFSGHKDHLGFAVTPSTLAAFGSELAAHQTGKGTLMVPYDAALPTKLLRRMISYRIKEYEVDGVKWR